MISANILVSWEVIRMKEKEDDSMAMNKADLSRKPAEKDQARKQHIRSLTHKICDRNDEGLRRLSKN
jgi:hypothetical protein